MFKLLILTLSLSFLFIFSDSKSSSSPIASCDSLMPGHGYDPQNTPLPYLIDLNVDCSNKQRKVKVKITSRDVPFFKGIMSQFREEFKEKIFEGEYSDLDSTLKLISCQRGKLNTVSHQEAKTRTSVSYSWTTKDMKTKIEFLVTLLKDKSTFWYKKHFAIKSC